MKEQMNENKLAAQHSKSKNEQEWADLWRQQDLKEHNSKSLGFREGFSAP